MQPQRSNQNNSGLILFIAISSILTCGLIIPVWLLAGAIVAIIRLISPPPKPKQIQVKEIPVSNEFADDWQFKIYDLEEMD